MHFTVVHKYADVAGVRTGKRTLYHSFLDTLEDGGHEAKVDGLTVSKQNKKLKRIVLTRQRPRNLGPSLNGSRLST